MTTNVPSPIATRLSQLGLTLPDPPKPAGRYRAAMLSGATLHISGQLPLGDGRLMYRGQVGSDLTVEEGRSAMHIAALNVLSQIRAALGDLDRLKTLLFVEGHVASAPGFYRQPEVLDAASGLFEQVLAEKAGHARSVFAPLQLPLNSPVILVVTAEIAR